MDMPSASVILSTYNQPRWLERALWGYAHQDRHDFELVIADDGSGVDTTTLIARMREQLPFPVQHVRQEDQGFRKCTILNRGIQAARSDYLIFSDGDCVPRADFVSRHLHLRASGRYLAGGYCKLPAALSEKIDHATIAAGLHCDWDWLIAQGLPRGKRSLKLWSRPGWRERVLNAVTPTPPRWAGNNASGWKADLLAVNGFDERMTYGSEDLELGDRLTNNGVTGKQIRFAAICIHLDHPRHYVEIGMRAANEVIREHTRSARSQWTEYGIIHGPRP